MIEVALFSEIVLDLYRGAQTRSVDQFPAFALTLVQRLIGFDMSMFGLMTRTAGRKLSGHYLHVLNEQPVVTDEWLAISARDTILNDILCNLGTGHHYHVPHHFRAKQDGHIRDYAHRRRHVNVMALALPYGPNQVRYAMSLRRADPDWLFCERDARLMELVVPHVAEAFRINRAAVLQKANLSATEPVAGFCVFDTDGLIVFQDAAFATLAAMAFDDYQEFRIPAQLHLSFCRDQRPRLLVRHLLAQATRHGRLIFLAMRPQSRFDLLTTREQTIAKFYGTGLTSKEIGQELAISSATVRRHVEAIYFKLGIKTKADLAFLVQANAGHELLARKLLGDSLPASG